MFRVRIIFLSMSALFLAAPALADDEYDACVEQSDGSNHAWAEYGGAWIEREDKKLNQAWKQLLDGASDQMKADLRTEQRAWIAYKDASCMFYASGEFGREGQVLSFPSAAPARSPAGQRNWRPMPASGKARSTRC